MLYAIVLGTHVFVCLVLIAVILLQAGRGGGLADSFGGGAAQSIMGTRGTVYLTRATTLCAVIFIATSLTLDILSIRRGHSLMEKVQEQSREKVNTQTAPPTEPKGSDTQSGSTTP